MSILDAKIKLTTTIIVIVCLIVFSVGAFFVFRVGVTLNTNNIKVTWSAFNTSLAILELYIVVLSIFIGIAALFGYKAIKTGAYNKAEQVAEKVSKDVIREAVLNEVTKLKTELIVSMQASNSVESVK